MLQKVTLPVYTKAEEILNAVSHGLGVPFGILCLTLCIFKSSNAFGVFGSVLFCVSMIILYSSSTLYHSLKRGKAKQFMRLVDHSVIFLLISGTSIAITIICIYPYNPVFAITMNTLSLLISVIGVVLTLVDQEKFKKVQMFLYMLVGWISLVLIHPIVKYFHQPAKIITLIVIGGIVYMLGTIFYALGKKKKYFHSIFHIFVLIGSVIHFFSIYQAI